ncbi:methylmalonyl-CoA mutase metallochaperone MeaB [Limimonas halophila]|uniref:Methylmalonyl-CoA mutase metallochaperone MeaB n=1 Tax=Limimonas halophila TaxID=1082479 RepID=A0A1G7L4W6_9PROT|nr:methylmalonyl Co-A mutase-associated GTPase MeaB [Limimonas halophila]SDF44538.1 methylmalonyl-CoA mutase metallochaperone MeaB [Limimonas halophila]
MTTDVDQLAARIRGGDRRALARAITLVESTRADHRATATELLDRVVDATGTAVRLGISGVPGVGKSTFIEAFGLNLTRRGKRVAVLAVDPTSARTGGAILGDKTRMQELARTPEAFIRPSPTGGTLGGVARRTREAMLLCEAAGFDVVIVETVGVGQAEITVSEMVDLFLLLLLPGAGDDLQGIKKGISEIADVLVVNKADSGQESAAEAAAAAYTDALRIVGADPTVLTCSALEGRGIDAVWAAVRDRRAEMQASGTLDRRRSEQADRWMWAAVEDTLLHDFRTDPAVAERLPAVEAAVREGRMAPGAAARELLAAFRNPARKSA